VTSVVTAASIAELATTGKNVADEPHYPRTARRVGGTFPGARGACRGRLRSGADFGGL